uniref:Protein translocase subunit SecA n=1 Tax=Porphyra purpurea TaxID=2787 RepID=SECA_PORPU|nr:preprotein translocase subunit SecA [Porphyra purpurea]P51381.1 RecName: Full=Protein translocase subunit SecA [Porphyra purpurea]AAC08267.1 Preprotein translocase subunit [Porphyra purpurea]
MFNLLFSSSNQRRINSYAATVKKINSLEQKIGNLSDEELFTKTSYFKDELKKGVTLDYILPEAFSVVREAGCRVLGLRVFDVQIIGAIILHQGKIAEMKTGEGKTLVATLAGYLNALSGKGVHIVTVNDYLARRDSEWVGQIHKFLGLSVGLIQQDLSKAERKLAYQCDVTYVTNSELGFDYLKDNMVLSMSEIVQNKFAFCIIDEVDSILIDEARTPLIISGPSEAPVEKYTQTNLLSNILFKDVHYEVDEKARNIILTDKGTLFCEDHLSIDNLYDLENPWVHYILNAIKAKELFIKDVHYIIRDNQVVIVDEFTGRIMSGRRWSDGLHQAIEAKEQVPIQQENQTYASITYQNFFLLYPKLSGMTGTAKTEESELDKIYNLEVICVPTHRPLRRKEFSDLVYSNEYRKWEAIADECYDMYRAGRPTLVGTTSVEKSELLSKLLTEYKIPHSLLNAKPENVEKESDIIAQAGRQSSVTIATNMAGRGTDIILGGNPSYIAKSILIDLLIKKISVQNNLKLQQLSLKTQYCINQILKSLEDDLIYANLSVLELEKKISIACEQVAISRNLEIQLRKAYQLIFQEYENIFSQEKKYVAQAGGLHVIGTERHESRRIDNQLRGRAGRQGDPGSSRFFLSIEDNLLRIFGGNKIADLMQALNVDDDTPMESTLLSKSLEAAQKKVEAYFYDTRKQVFEYDQVLNSQRQAIYAERRRILESGYPRDCILQYAESTIDDIVNFCLTSKENNEKFVNLNTKIKYLLNATDTFFISKDLYSDSSELKKWITEQVRINYDLREAYLEQIKPGLIRQLEKYYLLQQIDNAWKDHLQKMGALRDAIGWRSYGQQDPLVEYKNEAFNLFIEMITHVKHTVVYAILRSRLMVKND